MKRLSFPVEGRARRSAFALLPVTLLIVAALLLALPGPAAAQDVDPPPAPPDGEIGLELFGERCANCHGPLGLGDGEMAGQLPRPPASLDEVYVRTAVPADMFDIITNGRLEAGMPPFGPTSSNPIDEVDRWHLIAAVYSLGTPAGVLEEGEEFYSASCAECHGEDGVADAFDLTDQTYWIGRSNEDVRAAVAGDIPEHTELSLEDEQLYRAVSYARTFSYELGDPMAAFAPIESAVITGTVTNATTGETLGAGSAAVLTAFTPDFNPSTTMTTTLDSNGQFAFDLSMVAPDLAYVVTVEYQDLNYGSEFARLERDNPTLELPVEVYEPTTDDANVVIDQLHVILEFTEGELQVNELYQFSQNAPTVYVGETGDPDNGTVVVSLPEQASTPSFDRTFGGMESFIPADNILPTGDGWADTVALRPDAITSLLVRYAVPYDDGVELSHLVGYDVRRVNLVLPDVGVTVVEDGTWQAQDAQAMAGGMFLNFAQDLVPAGASVTFTLEGEPEQVSNPAGGGAANVARDQTTELLIGGGVLLLVLAVGVYVVRLWQQNQLEPAPAAYGAGGDVPADDPVARQREELLVALAELDDAYEAGEIDAESYASEREQLKEALLAIWE